MSIDHYKEIAENDYYQLQQSVTLPHIHNRFKYLIKGTVNEIQS